MNGIKPLLVAVLAVLAAALPAQNPNDLYVLDPLSPWRRYPAVIEEATLAVRPAGVYAEVELFLTFSARGTPFYGSHQLEVVFDFQLPAGAIVHDSWLWVDTTIIRAAILDRWTASGIYEEIVGRRQDPSILFKQGPTTYQLRVFPMRADGQRRVKISYLAPGFWTREQVLTALPADLLATSQDPFRPLELRVWAGPEWGQPRLLEQPDAVFQPVQSPELGAFWRLPTGLNAAAAGLTLAVDAPLTDGIYLSRRAGEPFYQLAFLPAEAFGIGENVRRKLLLLLDYNPENSRQVSQAGLLQQVRQHLLSRLAPADSFNLILSGLNPRPLHPRWLPADAGTITAAFEELGADPIANYNQVPALLSGGIDHIRAAGGEGHIVLFSNSGQEGGQTTANALIRDLQARMGEKPLPIHVVNYQDRNLRYYTINNRIYPGNEYLYLNLTRLTSGAYAAALQGQPLTTAIATVVEAATALRGRLDLHTTLANGFCYARYPVGGVVETVDLSRPVLQVGRYEGAFPFVLEVAGAVGDSLFADGLTVPESAVYSADTLIREMWMGNHLQALEREPASNPGIAGIIDLSLAERVLSLYTAFIALEPSQGGEPCFSCLDRSEGDIVAVDPVAAADSLFRIEAFPNPFHERLTIELSAASPLDWGEVEVGLFNVLGQYIRDFPAAGPAGAARTLRLTWDGADHTGRRVAAGVYTLVVRAGGRRFAHKIVYRP